ncbi:MAG: HlyD family efflux transporter periplasmic adaptor subunit [Bacteroidales bacterium]|nr:HlyD family efflux transporter periplasmic adaptor subunit [Bacteroidales bacterium]
MKRIMAVAGLALMLNACGNKEKDFDATGVFEATETVVYAEQNGSLTTFDVDEGDRLEQGREVALIDTVQLWLKIAQTEASRKVYQSQKPDMEKQLAATREQLAKARQEQQRYRELVADGAAPRKMLDDADSQVEVLQRQVEALRSSLSVSTNALDRQMEAADVQREQLLDQLAKCHVRTPVSGTVIEKYVERGEFVAVGKPLFKMADTDHMFMRAYVTSAQLQHIRVGQKAKVYADYGKGQKREYAGTVTWISSQSEFTPKTILTDDERADLVYALKVAVKNDGYIKMGMYGEVKF